MSDPFRLHALDGELDPSTWTPIVPPADYDHLIIVAGSAALTLKGATGTDSIGISSWQQIAAPPPRVSTKAAALGVNYRFHAGATVGYLKTASGTGAGAYLLWA